MSGSRPRPSVLHVIVRAGPTNSQYNEHCLPVKDERRITVCSLFPADVTPPPALRLVEGDGTARGCMRALRRALDGSHDIVHAHAPAAGVLTLVVYLLSWRSRRNLVFTVHNSWGNFPLRNRALLYLIVVLYPTVVLCGQAARDSMPRVLSRVARRKLHVASNGVDVDRIDRVMTELAATEPADDGLAVLSVNRLIPLKDPATVLQAWVRASGPTGELRFVGDGPLREDLLSAVLTARLQRRVTLTGIVERDEVFRRLSLADVFVSASGGEGLPVAVLEAMACECPVILSDIPPHREIAAVAPGVRLVPVGDVEGFARALRHMGALLPAERRELGAAQRQCVVERFSVRTMNDTYGEIYMRIIERNGGPRRPFRAASGGHMAEDNADTGLMTLMRHRLRLVAVLVVLGGLAGFGYSKIQAPQYDASASLLVGDVIGGPADEQALKASAALAASYADLSRREPVLRPIAARGFAADWRQLRERVHAQTGDKNAQLVQITATALTSIDARRLAEAVAAQVVALTEQREENPRSTFAEAQLVRLEREITKTQDGISSTQALLDATPAPTNATDLQAQVASLRATLIDLQASYQATLDNARQTGSRAEVRILEHAYAVPAPLRPDVMALVAVGLVGGLTVAAGWVYLASRRRSQISHRADNVELKPTNGDDRGPQPLRTELWADQNPIAELDTRRREIQGR